MVNLLLILLGYSLGWCNDHREQTKSILKTITNQNPPKG